MPASGVERIRALMYSGEQAAWSTAALVLALGDAGSPAQQRAARQVLAALGLDIDEELGGLDRGNAAAQAAAPLLQTPTLVSVGASLWAEQSDEAMLAQGRASAQAAPMFVQLAMPLMPGLSDALARPGARMLDVGTGVGALAVAYAEALPQLTVVGLDVVPRVLTLAAKTVAASTVADRVLLREQDVSTLAETAVYDLAWLPAPFLPEAVLLSGVAAVARALRPGGWMMLGHGKFVGDPVEDALNRFKTLAFGGTAINDAGAEQLLTGAGLASVFPMPTPPGAPGITVGRKPEVAVDR